jgi:peptidoglycan/LPS O-acetylase OafA/YrhL
MSSNATGNAPAWLNGGRIPCLDGLRALAILLVLFDHHETPLGELPLLHVVKGRCGFLGVQVFFVLSGFLITTLMLREIGATGRVSLRHFYLRRALRILPAYCAYLLVLGVLHACGQTELGRRDWLALGTYTVNFLPPPIPWKIAHVWSLSVEEHFYLLWPLVMAAGSLARGRRAVLACLVGALGLRGLLHFTSPPGRSPADVWTFTRIDDIAVGCLLALLAREPAWRERLDRFAGSNTRLGLLLTLFAVSQLAFSSALGSQLFPPNILPVVLGLANDVNSLTIALLLWAAIARRESVCGWVLNHPIAAGIGTISYSLYLWHALFVPNAPSFLAHFPQNFVLTFLVAGLSYALIEKPFLSWKLRLGSPRPPVPVVVACRVAWDGRPASPDSRPSRTRSAAH